jgi:acetolactate decarboxylase
MPINPMKKLSLCLLLTSSLLPRCTSDKHNAQKNVQVVGMMRNVMMKGELSGTIDLDTIANKKNLYGLGPVEYLAGEIIILDGVSFVSRVITDSTLEVSTNFQTKAPFFAYANIPEWKEQILPDSVQSIQQLEAYLQQNEGDRNQPFFFRLQGLVKKAAIHVVNLPPGSTVTSLDEAHEGQRNYTLENQKVEILGFYSTKHKAIFTHHDTLLHMHLITTDQKWMGHVDHLELSKGGLTLYLPKNQ